MLNNHTRNQRRMYRIHKMEEQIKKDEYIIGSQQQQLDKYKNVIDKIKEYIKENTRYYDKELGLVEMMGAGETRTPVVYLYGLLELLEEVE